MLIPFSLEIKNGLPISEQIVYAVKKAIISGRLRAGDRFPSVRALSQELRINPNTAHKIVTILIHEGQLEVRPGLGTLVAEPRPVTPEQRSQLLGDQVEQVVVEAKNLRLELDDLQKAVEHHWQHLSQGNPP